MRRKTTLHPQVLTAPCCAAHARVRKLNLESSSEEVVCRRRQPWPEMQGTANEGMVHTQGCHPRLRSLDPVLPVYRSSQACVCLGNGVSLMNIC